MEVRLGKAANPLQLRTINRKSTEWQAFLLTCYSCQGYSWTNQMWVMSDELKGHRKRRLQRRQLQKEGNMNDHMDMCKIMEEGGF